MFLFLVAVGLFISWLVPLHFPPWVSWHLEVVIFFAIFSLAWMGVIAVKPGGVFSAIRFPLLALPFSFLALLAVSQWTTGLMIFGGDVLVFAFYIALCVICLTAGFMTNVELAALPSSTEVVGHQVRILTALAFTLLLGAFASAVVAFAQVLDVWASSTWINRMLELRRPGGNLAQPNQLATLLLMGMVSLLLLYESGKIKVQLSVLILFVLCLALAMTESRTGLLSFAFLSIWWFIKKKHVNFKVSAWAVALTGIVFIGLFWVWPSLFSLIYPISGISAEVNTKAGTRLVVWPQLLEAISQQPWMGWGLGQIPKAHNAVLHGYDTSEAFSYSHNILLDLALGMGVPLTVLLVLATGVWLWRRVRMANQLLPWYCLAVVLPVAVHSMLEFPFAYAYFLVPVMLALGALEAMAGSKPLLHLGRVPAAAMLLAVSGAAAWSVLEYVAIEEDFRIVRFEALKTGKTPAGYEKPEVILLTQLGALLDGARIVPKPGMSMDELALAQKVALRYPWTATQNRYALSLALNGNPEEALRQLRVMRVMHGEKAYADIKLNWQTLAKEKYPELNQLKLP